MKQNLKNQTKKPNGNGRMVIPRRWSDLESRVRTALPALWPVSQDQHLGGVPTSYPELLTPKGIQREGNEKVEEGREGRTEREGDREKEIEREGGRGKRRE